MDKNKEVQFDLPTSKEMRIIKRKTLVASNNVNLLWNQGSFNIIWRNQKRFIACGACLPKRKNQPMKTKFSKMVERIVGI